VPYPVLTGLGVDVAGYGGLGVRTWRVSPSRGLPVPLCALLARVESLTSRLNGEEGVCMAMLAVGRLAPPPVVNRNLEPKN
jgi:hypothetical protein